MRPEQTRIYERASSVVFLKTDEPFGGLSNMAGGFPLLVNGIRIHTSEALYQACRFPHRPEVQALIIEQKSPMTAKMKSKPYRYDSRPDWDQVCVKIMRWCLRVKLAQNWREFSELLLETGERPIVEESRKDAFWGAKATDDERLVGMNALGRLLMELREAVRVEGRDSLISVLPLAIPEFLLEGRPIEIVTSQVHERDVESGTAAAVPARGETQRPTVKQPSLFDAPAVKEAPTAEYAAVRTNGVQIAELKPYAEYKESGLPWLGRVPGHWESRPAFGAFVPNHVGNHGMKEKTVLSLSYGRIVIKPAEKLHGLVPESFETYQIVNLGDIVLRTTDLQNDHTSLRVGMVRDRGIITSAYLALRTSPGVTPEFGFQFLNVWDSSKAIYGYGSGLRQNLDFSHFKRMPVAVPPPDEQVAIVRFLNWANGRLERATRAKRKVIALLNEQKQAIIHRAVTRGLDPSVSLKPSGIPWIGDIPQHWGLSPNRAFLRIRKVLVGERHRQYRLLSLTKRGVIIRDLSEMRGKFSADMGTSQEVRSGDLVFCLFDVPETPRTVGLSQHDGMITGAYTVMECSDLEMAKFLELFYIAMDDRKLLSPIYSGLRNTIPKARFLGAKTPIPPPSERAAILVAVQSETASLNQTISRLGREIELLREYRTRLVADVVTGKLDVRDAAARLPDEAPLDTIEVDANLDDETAAADEEAAA